MTKYVVVTRAGRLPVERFHTIEAAAAYLIDRPGSLAKYIVLAQEANKITASTPYRELRDHEKLALERKRFPTLYDS